MRLFDRAAVGMTALLGLTLAGNLVYLARQRRRTPPRWPRLSVVVPARNEEGNLPVLLASLAAQDYPDLEIVVYDDGSTDATPDVLAAAATADARLVALRGEGPPPGWTGKGHALHVAAGHATGERLLFLDADVRLKHPGALRSLVARHTALPPNSVLTGLGDLSESGGTLLVSLVAHSMLIGLPWWMPRSLRTRSLGALNGQVWLIDTALYRRHLPHEAMKAEVLEDVMIGRHLRAQGIVSVMAALKDDLAVRMYGSFGEAWDGFRKNAYFILGGTPASFAAVFGLYIGTFAAGPLRRPALWLPLVAMKETTDRLCGLPRGHGLLAPLSYVLSAAMAADSAHAHATGRVRWKGRRVAARHVAAGHDPSDAAHALPA